MQATTWFGQLTSEVAVRDQLNTNSVLDLSIVLEAHSINVLHRR